MQLETIIGLEVHIQAKTVSKMFCSCDNDAEGKEPNTLVCPVCMGHPGTLPAINKRAVEFSVLIGLGLGCKINVFSRFDRKNYFYPDLSKGYQITQHVIPVAEEGGISFFVPNDKKGSKEDGYRKHIRIERVQLEEDTAKSQYEADGSISLDFNRAGSPLFEIVTKPDFSTPYEAKIFLQELRMLARYLGVSDADMEKGMLRCDANISLRPKGDSKLYPKVEVKNINSFKSVERALEYEINRQSELWEKGEVPTVSATRTWNDIKGETREMRTKESYADYRYFLEPDVVPLIIKGGQGVLPDGFSIDDTFDLSSLKLKLVELPWLMRDRFIDEYGLSREQADSIVEDKNLAFFFEKVVSETREWLAENGNIIPGDSSKEKTAYVAKTSYGFIANTLLRMCARDGCSVSDMKCSAEDFAELITIFFENKINSTAVQKVLEDMFVTGVDPHVIIDKLDLTQTDDSEEIRRVVRVVIERNSDETKRYKEGKKELIQFFVGKVMQETKGKANPDLARKTLEEELS